MNLYPIMINLKGRRTVVIGGGSVAARKVEDLVEAEAHVTVVAPVIHDKILELKKWNPDQLELLDREYYPGDLKHATMAYVATNDREINRQAFDEAEDRQIFINAVDDPEFCSFYVPSFGRQGDFILAVSTSGASPAMAARMRRELGMHVPDDIDEVLETLNDVRNFLKEEEACLHLTSEERGRFLKRLVSDDNLIQKAVEERKKGGLLEWLEPYVK